MNILTKRPATIAEVQMLMKHTEHEPKPTHEYIKAFSKLTKEKADDCTEKLKALNLVKLNDEIIVKIIDFLPEDSEDLNKVFNGASLTEEEVKAILDIVKNY